MDWIQFAIFLFTIGGLFLWNRSESSNDRRAFQASVDAIRDEMKDFHGRLERQDAEFKAFIMYGNPKKKE